MNILQRIKMENIKHLNGIEVKYLFLIKNQKMMYMENFLLIKLIQHK
jgi:hypothetical protein